MKPLYSITLRILDLIGGFVALALTLRIIFRLLQANPSTPVIAWTYNLTDRLIFPFNGIFSDLLVSRGSFLDLSAFIAMIVYLLLFYALQSIIIASFSSQSWYFRSKEQSLV